MTGCRPGEAPHAEARHSDKENQLVRFRWDARPPDYVHKTARRTRKDRVIYLTPELASMVGRLAEKFPSGPLFRSRFGNQWTNAAVYQGLKRVRERLKLTGPMIAYSYRHTFATRWLLDGGSIKMLAELLGPPWPCWSGTTPTWRLTRSPSAGC